MRPASPAVQGFSCEVCGTPALFPSAGGRRILCPFCAASIEAHRARKRRAVHHRPWDVTS